MRISYIINILGGNVHYVKLVCQLLLKQKRMLIVNRNWLKYEHWDIFDKDVLLEHINISDISSYGTIIYVFNKNAKIIRLCQ